MSPDILALDITRSAMHAAAYVDVWITRYFVASRDELDGYIGRSSTGRSPESFPASTDTFLAQMLLFAAHVLGERHPLSEAFRARAQSLLLPYRIEADDGSDQTAAIADLATIARTGSTTAKLAQAQRYIGELQRRQCAIEMALRTITEDLDVIQVIVEEHISAEQSTTLKAIALRLHDAREVLR